MGPCGGRGLESKDSALQLGTYWDRLPLGQHSQTSPTGASSCRPRAGWRDGTRKEAIAPGSRTLGLPNTKGCLGLSMERLGLRSQHQTDDSLWPEAVLFLPFALRDQKNVRTTEKRIVCGKENGKKDFQVILQCQVYQINHPASRNQDTGGAPGFLL